jgi:hypothetical protein
MAKIVFVLKEMTVGRYLNKDMPIFNSNIENTREFLSYEDASFYIKQLEEEGRERIISSRKTSRIMIEKITTIS